MGKLVKLIGSGIVSTSEAIHAARNRPFSKESISVSLTPVTVSTQQRSEYVVVDDDTADALIQQGYAELSAVEIHQECAELPATSIHEEYAELPALPLRDASAELPGLYVHADCGGPQEMPRSNQQQVAQVEDRVEERKSERVISAHNPSWHGDLGYPNNLQRTIEPDVASEFDRTTQRVGLPTYSESEFKAATALAAAPSHESEGATEQRRENIGHTLVQTAAPVQSTQRISRPVILPQCTPGCISDGFLRSYAPVLADCGVSQDMFLNFLEDFSQASKDLQSIEVVSVATDVLRRVPETAGLITDLFSKIAAGTARETRLRRGMNTFLDRANQDLLIPWGLYAMVMKFKDTVSGQQAGPLGLLSQKLGQTFFATEMVGTGQLSEANQANKQTYNTRPVNRRSDEQLGLPQASLLVYPDSNHAVGEPTNSQKNPYLGSRGAYQKLKVAGGWVQDYVERKAQESKSPTSCSNTPKPAPKGYVSRYSDSNHPANNGKLISLLSGGRLGNKPGLIQRAATSIRESQEAKRSARLESSVDPAQEMWKKYLAQECPGFVKEALQQDVHYLFIVKMPTEEELRQSVALVELLMQQTR